MTPDWAGRRSTPSTRRETDGGWQRMTRGWIVRLLIYGCCRGVAGSRRIERATYEDLAFRYLAADQHPDHDTIASFRQEHLTSLAQLFVQVLRLCQRAGLVKLGHPAWRDWTGPRSRPTPASTRR